jgi:hypothetical protein
MGADALHRETGDALLAGYFLLYDGHEYVIGDITRPAVALIDHHIRKTNRTGGELRSPGRRSRRPRPRSTLRSSPRQDCRYLPE